MAVARSASAASGSSVCTAAATLPPESRTTNPWNVINLLEAHDFGDGAIPVGDNDYALFRAETVIEDGQASLKDDRMERLATLRNRRGTPRGSTMLMTVTAEASG